MTEAAWTRLLPVETCPPGSARYVEAAGFELAVFHLLNPDRFVVTSNACPHAGGNLAAGDLCGDVLTCPWHHWAFDLTTGRCTLSDSAHLRRYESRVEGGFIFARLNRPIPPDPPSAAVDQ